jgi:aminoglycoside 3-N-acetyltransferase
LPLTFMTYDDVYRSDHPVKSIAAKGKMAEYITSTHPLHESEGVRSPLHKLYELRGYVLMIGIGLVSCSALHLAEFMADLPYLYENNHKAFIRNKDGSSEFVRIKKYPVTSEFFHKFEPIFKKQGILKEVLFKRKTRIMLLDVFTAVNLGVEVLETDGRFVLEK